MYLKTQGTMARNLRNMPTATLSSVQDGERVTEEVEITIGKGCTYYSGSDRHPFQVTAILGEKKIQVAALDYRCTDYENQTYQIDEKPAVGAQPITLRRCRNGKWVRQGDTQRGFAFGFGECRAYYDRSF